MGKVEVALLLMGYALITLGVLAWMDVLWIFGVEDSQKYTWWGLMYYLGN